ncbi:MAG: DUF3891 family protein [Acidobacteriota bacterium]
MILLDLPDGLRVTTQTDHAAFSGELLSLWRADGLPRHPRRDDLIFAAREHDNGWQETDSAPMLRTDGDGAGRRPHDFLSMPLGARLELWNRGVRRHRESRPYGGLLILEHALELHRRHEGKAAWKDALSDWRRLRDELVESTGTPRAQLTEDYRWIDLADTLSLAACAGWREPFEHRGFAGRVAKAGDDGPTLHLDPFPLAGTTTFRIRHRVIPKRSYRGDADLAVELATARWRELPVRVAPSP